MNKRREPVTARLEKKIKKEVRKGLRENISSEELVKVVKIEFVSTKKHPKKISKRSSPKGEASPMLKT